jgi:hypothetical protein
VEDAKKFAAWLASPNGGAVPATNIKLILSTNYDKPEDLRHARPVKNEIDYALEDIGMNQTTRSADRLYFYFTGHGLGFDSGDAAMLLANASGASPYDNLGFSKYRTHLKEASRFMNLIYFLDCCRNVDASVEGWSPRKAKLSPTADAYDVKDYVFFATSHGRRAFEPPHPVTNERRGLFTQALLEALAEKKAADPQMRVTAGSLEKYLLERVPQLAKEEGLRSMQEPDIDVRNYDFQFASAESLPQVYIRVTAEPSLGGFFILADGHLVEIERYDATHAPWGLMLPVPGRFTLRHSIVGQERIIDTREIRDNQYVYHFGL